jgi:hypothetical protein
MIRATRRNVVASATVALLLVLLAAVPTSAKDPALTLHPQAERLPFRHQGPFVTTGDGGVLCVDAQHALRSHDEGRTWTATPIFRDPEKYRVSDERALLRTRDGTVIAAWMNTKEQKSPPGWKWGEQGSDWHDFVLPIYVCRSLDDGKTWEDPTLLNKPWCGCIHSLIETKDGYVVLVGQEIIPAWRHATVVFVSADKGRTWRRSNVLDIGQGRHDHAGSIEGTVVERRDGTLYQLLRTETGRLYEAVSRNGSLLREDFQPSQILSVTCCAQLARLADGRIALLWNAPPRHSPDSRSSREELSLAFSSDECATWSPPQVIAASYGSGGRVSYPYLYERRPGQLWVTTMQGGLRMKLNVADLGRGEIPIHKPMTVLPPQPGGIIMFGASTTAEHPGAVAKVDSERVRAALRGMGSALPVHNAGKRGATLAVDGKPQMRIVLADGAIPSERTAAEELVGYLTKVTGGKFPVVGEADAGPGPCLYIGPTTFARKHELDPSTWGPERWALRTIGADLVLVGGRPRGTLYAVYRFLEDQIGVRWWNAYEEHVPQRPTLHVSFLDRQGEPKFRYRDIYLLYALDGGRFGARNRLNGQGFGAPDVALGGGVDYGSPNGVHTFNLYIPPKEYFDTHPEWFSLVGGKRTAQQAQLCLTNPDLRAAVVTKLRRYIEQSRAAAEKAGRAAPRDFDISQNDWGGMCQCESCQATTRREGSKSGPLIDFLNHVADAIREEYPEVRINTLAYQMTEDPPKTLRPRDNVLPRLCDTNANLLRPITHPDNRIFAERLATWGRISKQLRIWDYAVTYTPHPGLPLPTVHTYAPDYRYFAEHNVEGVFTEHEHAILADLRDLKIWMMIKLLEDPYRDEAALLVDFTDGFYGPAGTLVRRYLADLQAAADAAHATVNWFPPLSQYTYLTLEFLHRAQTTFDEAEAAIRSDPVLLGRVRFARLPVDRACLVLWPKLMRQWAAADGQPEKIPLERGAIAARCRETWLTQIDRRFPASERATLRAEADAELTPLLARPAVVPLPERFRSLSPRDVFDFTAEQSSNWQDRAQRLPDPEADCGITNRLELSAEEMKQYKLPMSWGAYAPKEKRHLGSATIRPDQVPGPGYHWYKLPPITVVPSTYVYFFWSWIVQFPVESVSDPSHPEEQFEVWARIKFEGPGFPHSKPGQKNAICVERVIVVRHSN